MNNTWDMEIEGFRLVADLINPEARGIPVFFLHGICSSIYFWTPAQTAPFQAIGPCYALSLPGHFPAAFPQEFNPASLTPELISRLLSAAIRNIVGDRKVLCVGHSTGGFSALSLAIFTPQLLAGIMSVSGFASGRWIGTLGFNQWLVSQGPLGTAVFKKAFRYAGLNRIVYRAFWHIYVNDHAALWQDACFHETAARSYPSFQQLDMQSMSTFFAIMPHIDITPSLSKINLPTAVIVGDRDSTVPCQQSVLIAAKIPGSTLSVIKGAGHLPFFERPLEYRRAVTIWLEKFASIPVNPSST